MNGWKAPMRSLSGEGANEVTRWVEGAYEVKGWKAQIKARGGEMAHEVIRWTKASSDWVKGA